MTVNHGVPGSSPGEGATPKQIRDRFGVFFGPGREVYPDAAKRMSGSPGEGAKATLFCVAFLICVNLIF
jgi:hypothetical protein